MNSQLVFMYLLKSTIVAGIFLAYYWVALRNKRFHRYNRFYLLISLALSVVIPLLNFTWIRIDAPAVEGTGLGLDQLITLRTNTPMASWNWLDFALCISAAGTLLLLMAMALNISKIYQIKRKGTVSKMGPIEFIVTADDGAPFSFLKNLFWKESISLNDDAGEKILRHEMTHIAQQHTLDRLFCQLLCAICWINPFYWIIQKELSVIHEFIADEAAIEGADTESFAKMLLQTHYGDHFFQNAQSLFYSSIKRRLIMLTNTKNTRHSYLRRLIALPLLVLTIGIFSFEVIGRQAAETTDPAIISKGIMKESQDGQNKKGVTQTKRPAVPPLIVRDRDEKLISKVQEVPKFPGGAAGWQDFLNKTCNRNLVIAKGGAPGKYEVQLSFVIDKQGDVRDVEALNDPGFGSKEDAMRVLLSSPKWTPAMVNGKPVIYRDKISITYMITEQ